MSHLAPDSVEVADRAVAYRSLYIHLPFCRRRCPYCDFAVVALDEGEQDVSSYTRALLAELGMAQPWGPLDAVNFGGGTPSATPVADLQLLIDAIQDRFGFADGAEVSLEVNPEDVTEETAAAWNDIGFTRVSLGVQSFDDAVLHELGRVHTSDQATSAVASASRAGFASVSLDLIYGSPAESPASWRSSVEQALGLGTPHLSAYALTVELGTALSRSVAGGAPAPDPDVQADRYEMLCELTADAGLVRYEVSNWARQGHPARYNLGTWAQGEYDAVGLGAHGHRDGVRTRNLRRLDAYMAAVGEGRRPLAGSDPVVGVEAERERLMLGLRRTAGVEMSASEPDLRADEHIQRLLGAGVAVIGEGRLRVIEPLLTDEVSRAVLGLDLGRGPGPVGQ